MKGRISLSLAVLLLCLLPSPARAHPLGNFSVNQISHLTLSKDAVRIHYILDLAEIPTFQLFSGKNIDDEVRMLQQQWASQLSLTLAGRALPLRVTDVQTKQEPGDGGLPTIRVVMTLEAPWQPAAGKLEYVDANFAERIGWKNVVVESDGTIDFPSGNRYPIDNTRGLTEYPAAVSDIPAIRRASVDVAPGSGSATARSPLDFFAPRNSGRDGEADFISRFLRADELPLQFVAAGLLMAFALGALHALSPGHGKTIVAAYLAGNRGTPKHAVVLGAVVTFTHTVGVFVLGAITLFASRYVVPEKLYPWLGLISGLMIVTIGAGLLRQHWKHLQSRPHSHSHEIPEQINLKSLLSLGVRCGIMPCPSALVVLLTAFAMHRIALGVMLIIAFSFGLAGVLVLTGLLVLRARSHFERFHGNGVVARAFPVFSAILIVAIGLGVVADAILRS